jgi:ABC-type transport system substrate-binding protein
MRALVLAGLLAACNAPSNGPRFKAAGGEPRAGGTLHIAFPGAVSSLDPTIAYDELSFYVLHHLFDTLVDYAPGSFDPVPRLAERWEVSENGETLRFWLRSGLTFADGKTITAADFKYSLERAMTTPDSPFGAMLTDIVGAQDVIGGTTRDCAGITAPSDRELVIVLAAPNMAFLYVLAMPFATPQREDHVLSAGDRLRRMPLATGPYQLGSWDEGQHIVLHEREAYVDPARNRIGVIDIRENVPRDTQFLMLEAGELDSMLAPSAPDQLWVTSTPSWQPYVHRRPLLSTFGARFDVTAKPFDDVRVRQALNYALDKSAIVKLLTGSATPAHGILVPGMLGFDPALAPYPHDPAKAKALLAAAGYPDGFATTYVTTDDADAATLAQSMQADFAEVGVRVTLQQLSFATFATAIGKHGTPFAFVSWLADYPDPSNFLDTRFHSRSISDEGSLNASFYANPSLDALLDSARAERDPVRRAELYRRAERIVHDDAPWLWGYHSVATEVSQPYVKGFDQHPVWLRDFTTAWLDLDADGERVRR